MDTLNQLGIPMNPELQLPSQEELDKDQTIPSGSQLITYQPNASPIDFTEFLNIDEPTDNIIGDQQLDGSPNTPNPSMTASGDLSTPYIKNDRFNFPK